MLFLKHGKVKTFVLETFVLLEIAINCSVLLN